MGGYRCWEEAQVYFGHPRVYIDTSSALMFVSPEDASKIIHAHGVDHVFFGTDSPMWRHKDELERFNKLEITADERRMILSDNALRFFGLS